MSYNVAVCCSKFLLYGYHNCNTCRNRFILGLCDNLDKSIIEIISSLSHDNGKYPDTIVYYTKHINKLVHRAISELQKSKIYA